MAYTPPPTHYPPFVQDDDSWVVSQPWNEWFLNLGRSLGIEKTQGAALDARLTIAETDINALQANFAAGYTGAVPLAKLTGGGANGSLTIVNGLITAATLPT